MAELLAENESRVLSAQQLKYARDIQSCANEVQQILGHSDPSVTQRYAHLSTRSLQDAADSAADAINDALKDTA